MNSRALDISREKLNHQSALAFDGTVSHSIA
jgi:hypothetical protein